MLIATSGQETWVVTPDACTEADITCQQRRGYLFNATESSTWEGKGIFELSDQRNLGYVGNGLYGFDVVATGWDGNGVTVNHSIVAGTSSEDFYIGKSYLTS